MDYQSFWTGVVVGGSAVCVSFVIVFLVAYRPVKEDEVSAQKERDLQNQPTINDLTAFNTISPIKNA